ncbi:Fic family protein [Desulfosporosinus hippei]|uniref:Fic family protein n=1 Tax=Desulfosporosinus hippei DSM 8344 TaxID=1121419 RepID=A0A1G8H312_9FIRM|nr:Fic family protein [Desulfosporosinus hippei]SDI01048.1 Fic family protein [Desulfosporosinus hippei DSM 8344]
MELKTFTEMFSDKNALDFKKLKYKFGEENLKGYLDTLNESFYHKLPLLDFKGKPAVLLPSKVNMTVQLVKRLSATYSNEKYGIQAMEDEIISTLSIEQIDSSRESVRRILNGGAPETSNENKAYGIKRGLDFIAEPANKITEQNLYQLYMLAVGDFLDERDRLMPEHKYRHDEVYVVGQNIEHQGLSSQLLSQYMVNLIEYIRRDEGLDQVVKSIIIHYYLAYLHPYFDGNGRMARLIQLWYLVQIGYTSSLFIPFSAFINETKGLYYKAFTLVSYNSKVSEGLDVTPFVSYFVDNVLTKLQKRVEPTNALEVFNNLLQTGEITAKEKDLFHYVLSAYGTNEFSTKQLEGDYKNAAYATIRNFVLKLESKGLLFSQKYGNRVRYRVK